jgi:hypothetical protein
MKGRVSWANEYEHSFMILLSRIALCFGARSSLFPCSAVPSPDLCHKENLFA